MNKINWIFLSSCQKLNNNWPTPEQLDQIKKDREENPIDPFCFSQRLSEDFLRNLKVE